MARLIYADELHKRFFKEFDHNCRLVGKQNVARAWQGAMQLLYDAPTIEAEQEWISVNDELPKKKREYLCVCQFGDDSNWRYYNVLLFHPEKNADNGCVKGPHFSNEGMDDMRVTHWMELPELPEREGE